MKLIALAEFNYAGTAVKEGIFDGSEAELLSMQQYGPVRPATSTEIEQDGKYETAIDKHPRREKAVKR